MNDSYVRPEFENYVTIKSYLSVAEARVAQSTLESFGIDSFLADETMIGILVTYAPALGGVKLLVRSEEVLWALHYLDQRAEPIPDNTVVSIRDDGEDDSPPCPRCASDRVYPIETKKKVGVVLLFAGIVSIPFALVAMAFPSFRTLLGCDFECRECAFRF